ncbi:Hypothetical predicted protein [Octopus vulgaris]|uniref:Olfactomedin-like domain-containing protein n=1 Tax=Octopus vulgaris TaxID=6645 RepID=A0AA36BHU6_OCTVU|nr:Hypothetical predicted protein [Octopus vulgaris]
MEAELTAMRTANKHYSMLSLLIVLLLITTLPIQILTKEETFKSQNCLYAFNLDKNFLQIACGQGSASNFTLEKAQSPQDNSKDRDKLPDAVDVSYTPSGKAYAIRRAIKRNVEVPQIFFTVPDNETQPDTPDLEWIRNNSIRFLQIENKLISFVSVLNNVSKTLKDKCNAEAVVGIGQMVNDINVGVRQGAIMRDVIPENYGKTWLMYGHSGSNTLVEYDSELAFVHELVSKTYELPFYCEGTGQVVYKNALYCLKAKTNIMIRYDLGGSAFIDEYPLEGAGVHNVYPYQNNILSDVDFAVDEFGLWVTYSTVEADGKVVVSKLNENTMILEEVWLTNFPKKLLLNSFIVCGVLYGVEAPPNSHAFVRYKYDTRTGIDSVLGAKDMILPIVNHDVRVNVAMMDYNALQKVLHVWNNFGHVETYPVLFKTKE